MIHDTHHVAMATKDMDRLLSFYCDLLGLPLVSDSQVPVGWKPLATVVGFPGVDARVAKVNAGNVQLEFWQYAEPEPEPADRKRPCDVGIRHICFDVTDLDSEYARLVGAGVETFSAPVDMEGALIKTIYVRDPDGNIVELQEIFPGSPADKRFVRGL